jgi:long-chain acyl-CoA synthetase
MCDHSNVTFVSRSVIEYLENTESDIVLNVLPLSYGYGLYQPFMMFDVGATLILENSFLYPAAILQRMAKERVTGMPGIPTMYARLLQMDLSAYDLSSLRFLTNAAAALPTAHVKEVVARFPQAKFYSMYGLTETKRTLYLPPDQLSVRPDSVGIAIPGTECWVVDEDGQRLPPGEVGELAVRGRHVMRGYWGNAEASAKRFRYFPETGERVCFTGDLFRTDKDGYFYFVSRQDDIIKSRGEKVAPKEVEEVLYRLPGVLKAAVVGVPDPTLGQAVKAFLVVEGAPLNATQVLAYCRAHLEDYMVPKQVEFVSEMPVTPNGKIRKRDLTACAALPA